MKTKIILIVIFLVLLIFFSFREISFKSKFFYLSISDLIKFKKNVEVNQEKLSLIYEYFHEGEGDFFAIQGIEGFSKNYNYEIFIGNGYNNSIGYINHKNFINSNKIKNNTEKGGIELIADVYFKDKKNIFWTSYRNSVIYKSDNELNLSKKVFSKGFNNPIGINGFENQIIVANYGDHEIVKLNIKGQEVWRKKYYINFKLQKSPYGITVYQDRIFLSFNDHGNFKIIEIDLEGKIKNISKFLVINNLKIDNLQGIDVDNNGNLYLHDTGNKRILLLSNDLNVLKVLEYENMSSGRGLAILKPDNLLVVSGFKKGRKISPEMSGFWVFDRIN
jgi:hypothetical protein